MKQDQIVEETETNIDADLEPELLQFPINDSMDSLSEKIIDSLFSDERFKEALKGLDHIKKEASSKSSRNISRSSYKRKLIKMSDLIDKNRETFKLSKKLQFAKTYLEIAHLVYEELESELGYEFYLREENERHLSFYELKNLLFVNSTADLLYRIEKLVLTVSYGSCPAYIPTDESKFFDATNSKSIGREKKNITALGYELLFLLENKKTIEKMDDNSIYLSQYIKVLSGFFNSYFRKRSNEKTRITDFLDGDICFEHLNELNSMIYSLKNYINKGEFERRGSSRRAVVSKRKYSLEKNIVDISVFSRKLDKRLKDAIEYFRYYKNSSIVLYRFRVWLDYDSDKSVCLDNFKKFFSELNKKATKPEAGFKGYLNFFYYWDRENEEWFQDIVICIDADTLLSESAKVEDSPVRNIQMEFEDYALEILNHRGAIIFENEELPNLLIEPVQLLSSLDLPSSFLIDCGDRVNWKIFEEKILPYYCYHEILEIADSEVIDRFSRGRRAHK